jgi:decaprenylphospho-beta-D-erythro-pentofuranosid-2-ulose 2-reductase
MRRILIVGATSAIAEACTRLFAQAGDQLFLAARDGAKLRILGDDLGVRGAGQVELFELDVLDYAQHSVLLEQAFARLGGLDLLLIAHGTLPDQGACQASFDTARREFEVNALSVLSLLTLAANRFEQQRSGTIAVISSVAGERGRQSNYLYGAAKGAVSLFLQGLRNRLSKSGVRVVTILPGFVDTPMTANFPKGPLWAQPDAVARDIVRAIEGGRDVLYTPWFWRWIMLIIRTIPERIFKRLSL